MYTHELARAHMSWRVHNELACARVWIEKGPRGGLSLTTRSSQAHALAQPSPAPQAWEPPLSRRGSPQPSLPCVPVVQRGFSGQAHVLLCSLLLLPGNRDLWFRWSGHEGRGVSVTSHWAP